MMPVTSYSLCRSKIQVQGVHIDGMLSYRSKSTTAVSRGEVVR
jgi:hypothetical protein